MTKKSEAQKMADAITILVTPMTKEFEQIGLANQFVQSSLRQASRKISEIGDLVSYIEYRKSIDRSDAGENGSGDSRTNTDQQERQLAWKIAECKELIETYKLHSVAMKDALGKAPFENDWTAGIISAVGEF